MNNKTIIKIENFNLSYGDIVLYKDFNFLLNQGEIIGVFGPTGCGKTSLLNKIVEDYIGIYKISYVFQDNKIIKDITTYKNISLPIEKFYDEKKLEEKVNKALTVFDLVNRKNTKTEVLSGGEKQRVNLCRAFCYPCDIMLMDEPFSSQDEKHKQSLIEYCKKEIKKRNITSVIVSHNRNELESLCDSVIDLSV